MAYKFEFLSDVNVFRNGCPGRQAVSSGGRLAARLSSRGRLVVSATLILGSLLAPVQAPADASTTSASFLVSATVLSFCSITALPLAFGNYNSVLLSAASSVTVTCTNGTPYNVGLDLGVGTGATPAVRKMAFGANLLNYGLFSDAGHATVWGPTIATNTVTGTATGLPQILPVYGQIPASQTVAPGLYTDTVTATVTY